MTEKQAWLQLAGGAAQTADAPYTYFLCLHLDDFEADIRVKIQEKIHQTISEQHKGEIVALDPFVILNDSVPESVSYDHWQNIWRENYCRKRAAECE